ncbi:hypothetical protein PJK54_11740 [Cobetia sp. MMG027]|uniref:hypothetical protein n=1 Tax=Cobetia sp. MMG027 TaxID=3021980 RepID=UPI0022FF3AD4|nr:hypothetical protein [Cobetia sp. MMG027]MDA5564335.1 hypothetical protein [Cobetia sp. MMG027]
MTIQIHGVYLRATTDDVEELRGLISENSDQQLFSMEVRLCDLTDITSPPNVAHLVARKLGAEDLAQSIQDELDELLCDDTDDLWNLIQKTIQDCDQLDCVTTVDGLVLADWRQKTLTHLTPEHPMDDNVFGSVAKYLDERALGKYHLCVTYIDTLSGPSLKHDLAALRRKYLLTWHQTRIPVTDRPAVRQDFALWLDEQVRSGECEEALAAQATLGEVIIPRPSVEMRCRQAVIALTAGYLGAAPYDFQAIQKLTNDIEELELTCRLYADDLIGWLNSVCRPVGAAYATLVTADPQPLPSHNVINQLIRDHINTALESADDHHQG